eukprot:1143518-Prymnesium_polylepis.1
MFGPGRTYAARGVGARRTISSSASVYAVARTTADSAKTMAAETAATGNAKTLGASRVSLERRLRSTGLRAP